MRALIRGPVVEPLLFYQFASGVYPDMLMVYLHDSDSSDPQVFLEDHETLWKETSTDTLSGLLESFKTIDQVVADFDAKSAKWVELEASRSS